ncbi:MAG: hypothetical protein FWG40_10615 [Peptococcaceae bacterium]|nr:hypothetical protein [Peptococcaceae bacterium]
MEAIEAMKKLVKESATVATEAYSYGDDRCCCVLVEEGSDYKVTVNNIPGGILVLKCDKFPNTKNFFRGARNECKLADYVILSGADQVILIIELKRSNNSSNKHDIVAQLKGAKCLLDYCASLIDAYLSEKDIFRDYQFRYYKWTAQPRKRAFREKEKGKNDRPEQFRKVNGVSIQFKKLLS